MASSPSQLPRRRNGKAQACEPCRKRKVSCSHEVPACSRCRRRKIASACMYVVDGRPMQFGPIDDDEKTPSSLSEGADEYSTGRSDSRVAIITSHRAGLPATTPSAAQDQERHPGVSTSPPIPSRNAGYLGATSFEAMYLEAESSLASVQGASPADLPLSTSSSHQRHPMREPVQTSLGQQIEQEAGVSLISLAVETLKAIPDRETGCAIFKRFTHPNDGWNRLVAERIMLSIYDTFGSVLSQGDPAGLRVMAQVLIKNSQTELNENISDTDEWISSFSGQNLRWEALGIIFGYWASTSVNYCRPYLGRRSISNGLWREDRDKRSRLRRFKEAAGSCIRLADPARNANLLVVYLQQRYASLESNVSGDSNPAVVRLHAEACSIAMFIGMHAESPTAPYVPTLASEARRRCLGMICVGDRSAATFTGRPPLLSRRYISTPLPLDLPDDIFMSGPAAVAAAVARLDPEGWNTDNKIYSTTVLRARTNLSYIKDAIVETTLGHMQDRSIETLLYLRQLEIDTFSKFPAALYYHHTDIERVPEEQESGEQVASFGDRLANGNFTDATTFYAKVVLRLEHLQNLFFLERLLAQSRGHAAHRTPDLISISLEMVALTLIFWTHKNRFPAMQDHLDWLVMSYAAPAGGVLCMELMDPSPVKPAGVNEARMVDERVSRSAIIQNMSLLVGFLGWVALSAPNGDMCRCVKGVIQRVLDHTLNNPNGVLTSSRQQMDLVWDDSQGDMSDLFFNFELMDTFGWLRPDIGFEGAQTT